jgi:hypothetical protein
LHAHPANGQSASPAVRGQSKPIKGSPKSEIGFDLSIVAD